MALNVRADVARGWTSISVACASQRPRQEMIFHGSLVLIGQVMHGTA